MSQQRAFDPTKSVRSLSTTYNWLYANAYAGYAYLFIATLAPIVICSHASAHAHVMSPSEIISLLCILVSMVARDGSYMRTWRHEKSVIRFIYPLWRMSVVYVFSHHAIWPISLFANSLAVFVYVLFVFFEIIDSIPF